MVLKYSMLLVYITAVMSNPCHNQQLSTGPHPHNCNTFIVCWMSHLYFQACPIGSLFDTVTNNCQPWPVAQCCNVENPNSRHTLPSSISVGTLVTRVLSTEKNTFSTKLLPDDVTIQSTTFPFTEQQILTEKTDSADTKIIFKEKTTTVTPEITGYTLQPITITTLSHESEPRNKSTLSNKIPTLPENRNTSITRNKSMISTTTLFTSKTEINTISSEPNTASSRLSTISANKTTLPPVTFTLANNRLTQKTIDTSVESTTIKIENVTDIYSKATIPTTTAYTLATDTASKTSLPTVTPALDPSEATKQTSDVSVESTTPKLTSITDNNSKVTEPKTATVKLATFSTSRTTIGASETPIVNDHTLTSTAFETTKHNLSPAITTTPTEEPCWICSTETEEDSAETTTAKKDSETTQTLNTKIPSTVTEYYKLTTKRPSTPTHMSTENKVIEANTSRKPIENLPPVTPTLLTSGASEQTSDVSVESTTPKLTSITDITSTVTEPKTATGKLATFSTSRTTIGASETPIVNEHTLTSAAIETTKHNLSPAITTTPTEEPCWICSKETEEDSAETTTAKKDSETTQTLNTKIPSTVTEYYKLTTKRPLTPTHMSTENEVIEAKTSRKPIETLPPVTPTLLTSGASEQTSDVSVESTTPKLTSITHNNSKVTEPKTATGKLATFSTSRTTIGASETPIVNDHTLTSTAFETTKHNLSPAITTTPTEEPCWICSTETEEDSAETTTAKKNSETTQTLNTKIPSTVTEYYKLTTKRPSTPTHMSTENKVIEANTSRKPIETLPPVTPTLLTSGASEQTSDVSVESTTPKLTSITDITSTVTEPKTATGKLATFSTSRTTIGASETPIVNDHTLTSAAIETTKHNLSPAITTTPTEEPCWICSKETEEDSAETTTAKKDSETTQTLNTKIPSTVTEYYKLTTKRPSTPTHMSTENKVIEANTSRKPIETLPPVTPTLLTSGASEQTSDVSVESTTPKLTSITDITSTVTEPKTATGKLATFSTSRTTIGASETPIVNEHTLTSAAIETTKHNLSPAITTTPTEEPCWICSKETEEDSAETTTAKKDSETTQTLNTKIPSTVTEYYKLTTKRPSTPTHMSTENKVIEANTSRKPIETLPPVTPTLLTSGASEQTSDVSVESTTPKLTSITHNNSKVTEPKTATVKLATFSTSRTTIGASETPIVNDHTLTSTAFETTKHNLSPAITTTPTEEPCWICSTETEEDSAETTTAKKNSETTQTLNTKIPSTVTEYYKLTTKRPSTPTHMSTENKVIEANTFRKPIETLPPVTPTLLTSGASEQTSDVSVESTTPKLTSITDITSTVTEPKTATGKLATFSTSRTTIGASETPIVNDHTLTFAAIETTKHNLSPAITTTPTEEPCWICSKETEEDSAETTTAKKDSETTQTLNTKIPSTVTEYYKLTTKRPSTPTHMSTENKVIEANTSRKPIETLPPVTPTLLTSGASEQTSDVSVESTTPKLTSITDITSKVTEPKTATGKLATFSTSRTTIGASETPIVNDHTFTSAAIETTKHNLSPAITTTPTEEPCWICSTETEEDSAETTTAKKDSETTQTLNTKIPSTVTEYYKLTTKRPSTPTHMSTENKVIEANTSRKPIETLPPVTPTLLTSGASEQTSDVSVESTTPKLTSITDITSTVTEPKTATGKLATFSTSRTTIGASETPIVNDHTLTSAAIETTKHNLSPAITTTPTEEPCWICSKETEEDSAETTTAKKDSETTQTLNTKIPSTVTEYYKLTTKRPSTPTHMSTENKVIEANTSRKPIETLPPVTPTLLTSGASEQTSDVSVESTTPKLTSITDITSKVTEPKTATGKLATFSTSRTTIGASETPIVNEHTLTSAAIETTKHNLSPAITTTPTEEPCWICSKETEEDSAETTTAKKDSETTQTLNTKIPSTVTEYYKLTTKRPSTPTQMSTENKVIEANTSRKPIETLPPVTPTLLTSGASEQTSDVSVESTTPKLTSITDITSTVTEPKTATGKLATFSTSRTTIGASETPIVNDHTLTSAAIETTKHNLSPAITTTPTEEPCWICSTETEEDSAETTTAKKDSATTQTLNTKILRTVTEYYKLTTKGPLTPTHMSTETEVVKSNTSRKPIGTASTGSTGTIEIATSGINSPTLLPTTSRREPPCPYLAKNISTVSEAPTELQLPDCHTNDKYFYPDLLNCNFYFKCLNGVMERMNCKPNFGFNPHLMKCVPEDSAKCGEYKSTADQKLYLVTFMLFHHIVENKQIELNKDEVESYLR